ncbi:MAG: ABC transporter substrate-binding protein [Chloroflexi bacterium]|nr:ABC transporter substrate-binding protein [Chloroflexota bacterium]
MPTLPAGAQTQRPSNAASYKSPAPLNPPVKIKSIDNGIVSTISAYEALDKGYFKDEGLDVELVPLSDPAQSAQLIATNQAQYFNAIPDPVIFNAIARGIDVRVLVSSTTNRPTDRPAAFMVRQDLIDSGKYKSPADLKGMTVAIGGAASATMYIERVLQKGGLTLADIKTQNVGGLPDIVTAFRNKGIDAGWQVEPLITATERQGLAKAVFGTGELYPGGIGGALIMSPTFAKDNREAATRYLVAYLRGQRDYYHALNKKDVDPTPVIASLVAHTAVKDPSLYATMGLPSLDPNGDFDPKNWDVFQDFYIKQNLMQQKVDLTKYGDPDMVKAALDRLGRESS